MSNNYVCNTTTSGIERQDNKFKLKLSKNNGKDFIGTLYENEEGFLQFEGDVHESAEQFFNYLCSMHVTEVNKLRKEILKIEKRNKDLEEENSLLAEGVKLLLGG